MGAGVGRTLVEADPDHDAGDVAAEFNAELDRAVWPGETGRRFRRRGSVVVVVLVVVVLVDVLVVVDGAPGEKTTSTQ